MPTQTVQRHLVQRTGSPHAIWRYNHNCRTFMQGNTLPPEVLAPAIVHCSSDGCSTIQDSSTRDAGLGVYVADLPTKKFSPGTKVDFTFYWTDISQWEKTDFCMTFLKG